MIHKFPIIVKVSPVYFDFIAYTFFTLRFLSKRYINLCPINVILLLTRISAVSTIFGHMYKRTNRKTLGNVSTLRT